MKPSPTDASTSGFDRLYGLELVEVGEGRARAQVAVREQLLQPRGAVHGGIYTAIGESLSVTATDRAVAADGKTATTLSSQTSLLRAIGEGTIHALAIAKHRGRTTWVWEVELSDDQGRLCALARVTVALTGASAA